MKNKETKKKRSKRIKTFFTDFKAFIAKGNILDLAVAVIIGGAFGKIVSSLVNDIIMPLITLLVGGKSVTDWKKVITPAVYDANGIETVAENAIRYGMFLQTILDFLIIALFIFLALRICMRLKGLVAHAKQPADVAEEAAASPETIVASPETVAIEADAAAQQAVPPAAITGLLTEIRDLLKDGRDGRDKKEE